MAKNPLNRIQTLIDSGRLDYNMLNSQSRAMFKAPLTEEEKRQKLLEQQRLQAAAIPLNNIKQASQTRKNRQIVDGVDPALANVTRTDKIKAQLPGMVKNAPKATAQGLGNIGFRALEGMSKTGATLADVGMLPVDAVNTYALKLPGWEPMHRSRTYDEKTDPAFAGVKKTLNSDSKVNSVLGDMAEFMGPLALSGGSMGALKLGTKGVGLGAESISATGRVAEVAGAAEKALKGGKLGKAASYGIKTTPDMINTYAMMEMPKKPEDRTPFPEWAAMWVGGELAFKGAGVLGKKVIGKVGNALNKSEKPVDLFADLGKTEETTKPNLMEWLQAKQAKGEAPIMPQGNADNSLLTKMRKEWNTPVRAEQGPPRPPMARPTVLDRGVDTAKLPDQYPTPSATGVIDEITERELLKQAQGRQKLLTTSGPTPVLPGVPTTNWVKGTGKIDPQYQIRQLARLQAEAVSKLPKDQKLPTNVRASKDYTLAQREDRILSPQDRISTNKINDITKVAASLPKDHPYNVLVNEEVARMKGELGGVVKYMPNGQDGLMQRSSLNPKWYRDSYRAYGRPPSAAEMRSKAIENLRNGVDDIPANAEFLKLERQLQTAKSMPEDWQNIEQVINEIKANDGYSPAEKQRAIMELKGEQDRLVAGQEGPQRLGQTATGDTIASRLIQSGEEALQRVKDRNAAYSNPNAEHFIPRNPVDDIKDLTIIGAGKIAKTGLNYDKWLKAMMKEVGPQYEPTLKQLWEHSQAVAKSGSTVIKIGGQEIAVSLEKSAGGAVSQAANEKPATGQINGTPPKQNNNSVAAIKKHIENTKTATKYDGNEPARSARIQELEAELKTAYENSTPKADAQFKKEDQKIIKDINKKLNSLYDEIDNVNKNEKLTIAEKTDKLDALEAEVAKIKADPLYTKEGRADFLGEKVQETTDFMGKRKDITGFQAETQDIARNMRDFTGRDVELEEGSILDRMNTAKGANVDYQKKYTQELLDKVVKGLGIKKDSKKSKLVQQFGEGEITLDQLKASTKDWQKVVEAEKWFRSTYDTILADVNKSIAKIYPNQADKLVPARKDYFRHFRDFEGLSGFKEMLGSPSNISPELAGRSEFVKPNAKWASFKQKRGMGEFKRDAVGGFLDYLPAASYSIHIDPMIKQFRGLSDDIAKATTDTADANVMIRYLQDYANMLSGKSSGWDRKVQEFLEGRGGSRMAMNVVTWLNNRAKSNSVMLNPGSALSQLLNIPNGVAFAKQHSITGTGRALLSIFKDDTARASSNFMKERFSGRMYRQFDTKILDQPKNLGGWILETSDRLGTEMIWQSCYSKGLRTKGVTDPVKYADAMTKRLVAGRGIGEMAQIQRSKLFNIVAPFQVEVGNLLKVQKDFLKNKDIGALATLYVGLWVANNFMQATRGTRVGFDPIDAMIEASREIANPDNSAKDKIIKGGGRLAGEVLSNVPLGQTLAAAYPEYGNDQMGLPTRKELFGKQDPTRFGTGPLVLKAIQDPLKYLIPSVGGAQIDKVWRSVEGMKQGGAYSNDGSLINTLRGGDNGKLKYPVAPTTANGVKGILFGPGAWDETKEYYDKNRRVLSDKQTEEYQKSVQKGQSPQATYGRIINNREINSLKEKITTINNDKKLTKEQKNEQVKAIKAQIRAKGGKL